MRGKVLIALLSATPCVYYKEFSKYGLIGRIIGEAGLNILVSLEVNRLLTLKVERKLLY